MTMTQEQADELFAQQRETLASAVCKVELGFAFTVTGSVQVARIFREESYETKGGNWKTKQEDRAAGTDPAGRGIGRHRRQRPR